jgi:hypothetical protein
MLLDSLRAEKQRQDDIKSRLAAVSRHSVTDMAKFVTSSDAGPHDTSVMHRVTLSDAAEAAICRLITSRRISYAERAVANGKTNLMTQVKTTTNNDTQNMSYSRRLYNKMGQYLPIPTGHMGIPSVQLPLDERQKRVRVILQETRDRIERLPNGQRLRDSERQELIRKYLGLLDSKTDDAIISMDTPLPDASRITISLLLHYNITIRELVHTCNIPVHELYDAGIVKTCRDLRALHFRADVLGPDNSNFSVEDFVTIFGGSYEILQKSFDVSLARLPEKAFRQEQLTMLKFRFNERGTLDDLKRLGLSLRAMASFGLTPAILKNQFGMRDHNDLRRIGWPNHDINAFLAVATQQPNGGGRPQYL